MSRPEIGNANLGGARKRKNYFKIVDGNNIYRILPPMFNLATEGRYSMFHRVEFGYKNTDGRMKPFVSPRVVTRNGDVSMVEVESAAHLHRMKLKDETESLKTTIKEGLEAGTITKDEAKEAMKEARGLSMRYNLDSKHYLNVINENGEIGLLKIPNTAKKALQPLLDKLKAEAVNPMSVDNGRFFNFHRTGTGLDTQYTLSVVKDSKSATIDGTSTTVEVERIHVLNDAILDRLNDEAFKLDSLFPKPSAEEVERIVNEGPIAVDEILSTKKPTPTKTVEARTEAVAEDNKVVESAPLAEEKVSSPALKATETQSAPTPVKATVVEEDDDSWLDSM